MPYTICGQFLPYAVLGSAPARARAVARSPAAPASAQAPDASAFRRDTPMLVMSIRLFLLLGERPLWARYRVGNPLSFRLSAPF